MMRKTSFNFYWLICVTLLTFVSSINYKVLVDTYAQDNNQPKRYRPANLRIYSYRDSGASSSNGLISLSTADEPALLVDYYSNNQGSRKALFTVYKSNKDGVFSYLTHDEKNQQTQSKPDSDNLTYITKFEDTLNNGSTKIIMPMEGSGVWYITVNIDGKEISSFIVRSGIGLAAWEGDNRIIYWAQDLKSKQALTDAQIAVYNLTNEKTKLYDVELDDEGIAKTDISADADIAVLEKDDDIAIAPINLRYLNSEYYDYTPFRSKVVPSRYFVFTDRPLYKPGDTVYYKVIARDDDDARYSLPSGVLKTKVIKDYNEENVIYSKEQVISDEGTVSGEFKLPDQSAVGTYSLDVTNPSRSQSSDFGWRWGEDYSFSTAYFEVQYYTKPEFFLSVESSTKEVVSGDKASFKIKGEYFSGEPLISTQVRYSIYASNYFDQMYLSDYNYYNSHADEYLYYFTRWYGNTKVTEGSVLLNENGEAVVDFDTLIIDGKNKVFNIQVVPTDPSLSQAFSSKNILVYSGEFGIYRTDNTYSTKVNKPVSLDLKLQPYKANAAVAGMEFTAQVKRTQWISYQDPGKKYLDYRKEVENLAKITFKSDNNGAAQLKFTPTKPGSYEFIIQGNDARANYITKTMSIYVSDTEYPYYSDYGERDITVTSDKDKYMPGDTAHLTIYSYIPNRDVFLTVERGRVQRYKLVHLNGNTGYVDIDIEDTDMPNIYARVTSFSDFELDTSEAALAVSADSKKLVVNITPDAQKYGPGETSTINLYTTDLKGNPVSADVALWVVDKSLFELSDSKLGDIYNTYWFMRGDNTSSAHSLEGIYVYEAGGAGGCFAAGTQVLMADGSSKSIEKVKAGDYVLTRKNPTLDTDVGLVKAKVLATHAAQESGYLILNSDLKVTANHILFVNGLWQEAGNIKVGDALINAEGNLVKVTSVEWLAGKFDVYNLAVETYHSYFVKTGTSMVLVHNDKGGNRNVFKDVAYWNSSVKTNSEGKAKVAFKLPDNLTTWLVSTVGATRSTMVGQATTELKVSKDFILRPIVPNIFRVDDTSVISALMQNFSDKEEKFEVTASFEAGTIQEPATQSVSLKPNSSERLYWTIKPTKVLDTAKLTYSATYWLTPDVKHVADEVTLTKPVVPFGFKERTAQTAYEPKDFSVKLPADTNLEQSQVTLALSPSIIGSLPSAMTYLVGYPYGCVEQTTSRFVPAVIAKQNPDVYSEILQTKEVDKIIYASLNRLYQMQKWDGGWTWWFSGDSDRFVTSYVVEYMHKAKNLGLTVDAQVLARAQAYLTSTTYYNTRTSASDNVPYEQIIVSYYGLSQIGVRTPQVAIDQLTSADVLAMAVITNYTAGDTNPETNGLKKLIGMAQTQGDTVYWPAGSTYNFGSVNASTAFAIRAIITAEGDRTLAARGANYLIRNRNFDYWTNTFATSQVIRAITDLYKSGDESTPNYSYKVVLDGAAIAQGTVTSAADKIKPIELPVAKLKKDGSTLSVVKEGTGQIYSVLVTNALRTDKTLGSASNGMYIKREYINEKGSEYSLGVGDTVKVQLTVGGLQSPEKYALIADELPAGMVPINESFNNEQNRQNTSYDYNYFYYSIDREVTQNGMLLSFYQLHAGESVFTYRARVMASGTFSVPPATVSLMYSPEVNGRSSGEVITIDAKSKLIPGKLMSKLIANGLAGNDLGRLRIYAVGIVVLVLAGSVLVMHKGVRIKALVLRIVSKLAQLTNRKSV